MLSKNWLCTLNNPNEQLRFDDTTVRFAVWQLERGESGTDHFQLYIEFHRNCRLKACKGAIGGNPHCEARRGSQSQAIEYCTKQDTRIDGPWQFGTPSVGQGHRSDLDEVGRRAANGESLVSLAAEVPATVLRNYRGLKWLQEASYVPVWRDVRCFYLYGPPGTGKTSLVYDTFGYDHVYSLASQTPIWADAYSGQGCLLVDEYQNGIERARLNELLDGHPLRLPIKGGFTNARYDCVCIVSNQNFFATFDLSTLRRFVRGGCFELVGQRGTYRDLGEFMLGKRADAGECELLRRRALTNTTGVHPVLRTLGAGN